MDQSDFKDYATTSKLFDYKQIPYSKIAFIRFTQCYPKIALKISHKECEP